MCLTEAVRVIETLPDEAVVDRGGRLLTFPNLLAPEARTGDWVLVGMGIVLARLSPEEAAELAAPAAELAAPAGPAARPG
jgi:hydrogenase maturation factor